MKATLKFDVDEHEDRMAHKRCVKATDMASVIWEFSYNGKRRIEAEVDAKPDIDPYEVIDMVYKVFYEMLEDNNIMIDELYD